MKIEFIKRGAATRLILIFAGWSTDARYYSDCVAEGWDTAVVSDYRDMTMPEIPAQYSTVYVFAYSLGVYAAAQSDVKAAARIAICGSPEPVSDAFGIPVAVYNATADGLTAASLKKFHRRMAGDRASIARIEPWLPTAPDVEALKEELYAIASHQSEKSIVCRWDRVYIAEKDRIFPLENLERYWSMQPDVVRIKKNVSHAIEIAKIIKEVLPDHAAIGGGFSTAVKSYNRSAIVQSEICIRMGEIIAEKLSRTKAEIGSLLEIGVGQGLLTEVWRKLLHPSKTTFVDLLPIPTFGVAPTEEYIVGDAEEWLKKSTEKFDVILSASTIQWFVDPIGFIQMVKDHLNPGGFAVISTFTQGNLHQLDAIRPCPLIYRSVEEYAAIPGIETESWTRTLQFSSSREMLLHLRHTGVTPKVSKSKEHKEENSELNKGLSEFPSMLTYCPAILYIVKS